MFLKYRGFRTEKLPLIVLNLFGCIPDGQDTQVKSEPEVRCNRRAAFKQLRAPPGVEYPGEYAPVVDVYLYGDSIRVGLGLTRLYMYMCVCIYMPLNIIKYYVYVCVYVYVYMYMCA